jgi:hypothetical protein
VTEGSGARTAHGELRAVAPRASEDTLPEWVQLQLTKLVDIAPEGSAGCTKSSSTAIVCTPGCTVAQSGC